MRSRSQKQHSWTDEELKILSYLRYTCHWRFQQIQESYFPSLSSSALRGAYWHQSTEDRVRRASKASIPITDPRNSKKGFPSLANRKEPFISNERNSSRYNLRPNRPSVFPPKEPQYPVNRRHFPHFFRSYRYSFGLHRLSDSDYIPPSQTPTRSSSEQSVSIVSSLSSAASSLELFGLEARSARSSDRDSVTSNQLNDVSSSEFFSPEEFHCQND